MRQRDVLDTVRHLCELDVDALTNSAALDALAQAQTMQSWISGRTTALRRRIKQTAASPAVGRADADEAASSSQSSGHRDDARADTTGAVPEAQEALDMGAITAEHVDVITAALASLEPEERLILTGMGRDVVERAIGTNPDHYRANLRLLIDRLRRDAGQTLLERQKRATQLQVWLDHSTGMWCLNGRLDPELAAVVSQQLAAALRTRFSQATQELCPSDPRAKANWLRAHALGDIFAAALGRAGGAQPEVTFVVTAADGHVDTGLDHHASPEAVAELIRRGVARIFTVVTRDGQIIDAPGRLSLARTTRTANRAQRRALHALYPTCAIPGCTVDYRHCRLHHVVWWRHGGRTDLDNLLPLCDHHHAAVHDEGWQLRLGALRELTVIRPDGRLLTTGPPGRGP